MLLQKDISSYSIRCDAIIPQVLSCIKSSDLKATVTFTETGGIMKSYCI